KLRGDEYELDGQLIPSKEGMHVVADWVRKSWAGESRSDFVAMVNAYRAYKAEERRLWDVYPDRNEQYKIRRSALKAWCFSHFLNIKRLQEAERLMFMLKDELMGTPLQMQNGLGHEREFDAEALTKALASGMVDRVARLELDRRYNGRMGEFSLAFQSVVGEGQGLILAAQITKIPVKSRFTSHMLIGDLAAPLKAEWLEEVMPQLCWTKVVGEAEYEPKSDLVLHTVSKRFQDMEYACAMVRVTDRLVAKSAFLRWIVGAIYQYHDGQIDNVEAQARIEQNGYVLDRVRDLNARQGCEVLPHSVKWASETLSQQIGDATCVAELANLDDLVLPDPDKETVELILLDTPDTVEVAGQSLKVVYTTDRFDLQPPYVVMPEEILADPQMLPLESLYLPNGKLVRMVAKFGWHDSSYDHPDHLKRDLIEYAHERALANYVPDIAIPDPEDETAVIPPIETRVFGENAFTGEPLEVYVYVAVRGDTFYAEKSDSLNVAERERDLAVARFREVQRRAKDKRDMVQLKQKVDELGQQLLELVQEAILPDVLKQRLSDHRYSQSFLTVAEIRLWVTKAEGLVQEAGTLVSKARQAEEEQRNKELECYGIEGEALSSALEVASRCIAMLGQDEAELLLLEASVGDFPGPTDRITMIRGAMQDKDFDRLMGRLIPQEVKKVLEAAFNLAVESRLDQVHVESSEPKRDTSLASLFEFYGHTRGRG
ncbi:hypothetical protein KKG46_04655, partial [Patescibacteria group bacterium]|nr:hypothetical protein [Patescibacteria group bacterium]